MGNEHSRCNDPLRSFTEEEWNSFFEQLKTTSARKICSQPGMPSHKTLAYRIRRDPNLVSRYQALARPWAKKVEETSEVWETFLKRLKTTPAYLLHKMPDMPSATAFYKKRLAEPAFDARVAAIVGHTRTPKSGISKKGRSGVRISQARWDAFLSAVGSHWIKELCERPEMPSQKAVLKRCRTDPDFAAKMLVASRERSKARLKGVLRSRRVPVGELFKKQLTENELYAAVRAAVPTNLPPIARDDVICDMMLAILEGRLEAADAKNRSGEFVKQHWKLFGHMRDVSFDSPIFNDSKTTVGDRISYAED